MDIQKEKERILKKIEELNSKVTPDVIKVASQEDLLKYMELTDILKLELKKLEELEG